MDDKILEEIRQVSKEYPDGIMNKEIKEVLDEKDREIKRLNEELFKVTEQFRNIFEENMRLKRDINLYGGKLVITELEVKESWK